MDGQYPKNYFNGISLDEETWKHPKKILRLASVDNLASIEIEIHFHEKIFREIDFMKKNTTVIFGVADVNIFNFFLVHFFICFTFKYIFSLFFSP